MGIMRKDIKHGDGVIPQREKTGNAGALSRLNSYPAYKDSGTEWLGELPAHWEVSRLKHWTSLIQTGSTPPTSNAQYFTEGTVPWHGPSSFSTDLLLRPAARMIAESAIQDRVARIFDKESSMIVTIGSTIGKVGFVDKPSSCNQQITAVTFDSRDVFAKYAGYQLKRLEPILGGIAPNTTLPILDQGQVGCLSFFGPPMSEQRAIAAFLDRETAKIDALVAKKERLIELLQEKRTALISDAVTKGLDPDVPLKDSGVEWLGEIPAHWEVKQLRWAITFQRGHDLPSDDREEGDVPVVSSSGISSMHSKAVAKAPGIVTGRYGTIGQFYLINQSYWPLNTALYSIDLHGNEPRFLLYMLIHMSPLFLLHSIKSAVPGVDRNDVHADHTAVPHLSEQHAIAVFLDHETAQIDALIAKIHEAVDRLKELRTALISAAVTGKIDVREAAA